MPMQNIGVYEYSKLYTYNKYFGELLYKKCIEPILYEFVEISLLTRLQCTLINIRDEFRIRENKQIEAYE